LTSPPTNTNTLLNTPRRPRPPGTQRRPALLAALWLAGAALLALDLLSTRDLSLLAYFILPALVAAAFASPRQVFALAVAGLACGLLSGWHFETLFTFPYLIRLTALALIGGVTVWLASAREKQAATEAAKASMIKATMDSLLDPHVLLRAVRDEPGHITDFIFADANDAACAYNRLPRTQLVGRRLLDLLPAHRGTGLLDLYRRTVETGRPLALDDFLYPHEIHEEPRFFDIRAVKVDDALSFTWRDVTERHHHAAQLERRARLDDLTSLLNRRELFERLESMRHHAPRTGHKLAVIFLDFDNFCDINDTYGHQAGDEVLRVSARRLLDCLRQGDMGGRLGGDEMVVVLQGVHDLTDAMAVANKVRACLAEPIKCNSHTIKPTVSIGVTLAEPEETTAQLLARADEAMYRAKQGGRNHVVPITPPGG